MTDTTTDTGTPAAAPILPTTAAAPTTVLNSRITLSAQEVEGVLPGSRKKVTFLAQQKGIDSGNTDYSFQTTTTSRTSVYISNTFRIVLRCKATLADGTNVIAATGTSKVSLREDVGSMFFRTMSLNMANADIWTSRHFNLLSHVYNRYFRKHNGPEGRPLLGFRGINNDDVSYGILSEGGDANDGYFNTNALLNGDVFEITIPLDMLPGFDGKLIPTLTPITLDATSINNISQIFQTGSTIAESPIINVITARLEVEVESLNAVLGGSRAAQLNSAAGLSVNTSIFTLNPLNEIVKMSAGTQQLNTSNFAHVPDFIMLVPFYENRITTTAAAFKTAFPFLQPENGLRIIEAYTGDDQLICSTRVGTIGERSRLCERFKAFMTNRVGDSELNFEPELLLSDGMFAFLVVNRNFFDTQLTPIQPYDIYFNLIFKDGGSTQTNIRYYLFERTTRQLGLSLIPGQTIVRT